MIIITDNPVYADKLITVENQWEKLNSSGSNLSNLINEIFPVSSINNLYFAEYTFQNNSESNFWSYLLVTEYAEESQYDSLIRLAQNNDLPDGILCFAGSGKKFHGFRSRQWESLPGNIHLSVYLKPNNQIENYASGFLMLSAVSSLMSIDEIPLLKDKGKIKWVNDLTISGSKVCGVLAHTLARGEIITDAVLGIGLNVESTPIIDPTPFVPRSACLNDFLNINNKVSLNTVLQNIILFIAKNYLKMIRGRSNELLEYYRERSAITGKKITIWSDERDGSNTKTHQGIVTGIGENLELFIDSEQKPIISGRLVIED